MTTRNRIIIGVIALIVLTAIVVCVSIPACRNAIAGIFTSNDSTATTPSTSTNSTNPTVPEVTTPTTESGSNGDEEKEEEKEDDSKEDSAEEQNQSPRLTFAEFLANAIVDGKWHVPAAGATIFDMTSDEWVEENEEEKTEYVPVYVQVNPYGAMSVMQTGFDAKPAHAGEVTKANIALCDCEICHSESWSNNFGQFGWIVAEGNNALDAQCWTRMDGTISELLLNAEEREIIRQVACYWYETDDEGNTVKIYGIRVCGNQVDPEPPKAQFTVKYEFVSGTSGMNLPEAVIALTPAAQVVEEGSVVNAPNFDGKTVKVSGGTWSFKSWSESTVTITSDVTITGTWVYTQDKPVVKEYTVKYQFVSGTSGKNLPSAVTSLVPAKQVVKEGSVVNAPNFDGKTVKVNGGTWTFKSWNESTITVTGDITITGTWVYTQDKPAEPTTYTVSYQFVMANGDAVPAEILAKLPSQYTVEKGSKVTPEDLAGLEVKIGNKTYAFNGWDKTQVTVNSNVTFTGTWIEKLSLAPVTYTVKYQFVSGTSGKSLPSEVTSLLPANQEVEKGTKVNAPNFNGKTVKVSGGVWTFKSWNKTSATINGDTTFTGTWVYTQDKPAEPSVYTVSYQFVMANGATVPSEIMAKLPASYTIKKGSMVTPENLDGVKVEVGKFTYKFIGWNKNVATVNGDVTFIGTWLEELSLADTKVTYTVTIKNVSETGMSLPEAVTSLMTKYREVEEGNVFTVPYPVGHEVPVDGGVWTIVKWNATSVTVNSDVTLKATWAYTANTPAVEYYTASFEFVSGTSGKTLPAGVRMQCPAAMTLEEGQSVNVKKSFQSVEDEEGHWEFDGWNKTIANTNGDVTMYGTWIYVENESEESEDHVVADDETQKDLDEIGGPRAEGPNSDNVEGERETPSDDNNNRESLSLAPVEETEEETPVDDSVVADDETQNELDSLFGPRQ